MYRAIWLIVAQLLRNRYEIGVSMRLRPLVDLRTETAVGKRREIKQFRGQTLWKILLG
jgi:hypothetical protein